jgi:flagellar P-ring protein precursor FlgI
MRVTLYLICLLLASGTEAQTVRLKDLARVSAQRENSLVGYGVITGLSGTGDSARSKVTRTTLANVPTPGPATWST